MDAKLLIDAIMRQTTVLVAQLSTSSGIRAPLAHIADQVFLDLSQEIEAQGVGRKLVADMFGLALRSYQKKVQRLTESATVREKTLWEAVLEFLAREGSATRERIFAQFRRDPERDVAAVLADLVGQGLVYSTGSGKTTVYGRASEADQQRVAESEKSEAVAAMVWHALYRRASTRTELEAALPASPSEIADAVDRLLSEGRVTADGDRLVADTLAIPVGAEQGWEAAIFDHFSAVANAIAAKVRKGSQRSLASDRIGGTTITFEVYPGHPDADEVYGLLGRIRQEVNDLYSRVAKRDEDTTIGERERIRVTFYFGQNVEEPGEDEASANAEERS